MINLSKPQLDKLGTFFGVVAGICAVLTSQGIGNPKVTETIGGISIVLLGVVTNKPATASPTTEEVEEPFEKDG